MGCNAAHDDQDDDAADNGYHDRSVGGGWQPAAGGQRPFNLSFKLDSNLGFEPGFTLRLKTRFKSRLKLEFELRFQIDQHPLVTRGHQLACWENRQPKRKGVAPGLAMRPSCSMYSYAALHWL